MIQVLIMWYQLIYQLLNNSNVKRIYANGGKAYELYNKYLLDKTGIRIIKLPSTSPANARFSLEKLLNEWSEIFNYLKIMFHLGGLNLVVPID